MAAPASDQRILLLVALAALLLLALAGRTLGLGDSTGAPAAPAALQLGWDDGGLALCRGRECPAALNDDGIRSDLTPFFFQPIPINRADSRLLETVDGIGPHLAAEIIRVRDDEGVVFRSGADLLRVPGIGPKRLRQLDPQFSFTEAR